MPNDRDNFAASYTVTMELYADREGKSPVSLGDDITLDPISIQLNYQLNEVPSAVFTMPSGIGVDGEQRGKIAAIHKLLERESEAFFIRVSIIGKGKSYIGLNQTTGQSEPQAWPTTEPVTIWFGKVLGYGFTETNRNLYYTISSAHWLQLLSNTTSALEGIMTGSIDHYRQLATLISANREDGAGYPTADYLASTLAYNTGDLTYLWSDILRPMLQTVSGNNPNTTTKSKFNEFIDKLNKLNCESVNPKKPDAANILDIANKPAYELINPESTAEFRIHNTKQMRMLRTPGDGGQVEPSSPDNLPIGYLSARESAFYPIRHYIGGVVANNVGSDSMWAKLVTLGQQLMYYVVPLTSTFGLVPSNPVFPKSKTWRSLQKKDMLQSSGRAIYPKTLAGVALLGQQYITAESSRITIDPNGDGVAAAYLGQDEGQIMIRYAPRFFKFDSNPGATRQAISRVSQQEEAQDELTEPDYNAVKEFGCRYAKAIWAEENFKFRRASIRTPLRFDISPGSCLELVGTNLGDKGQFIEDKVYGYVTSVIVSINAQSNTAYTSFEISHLRSDKDEDAGLVPEVNAIYDTVWEGSPLATINEVDLIPSGPKSNA